MKKSRLISVLLTLVFLVSGISASSVFAAKTVAPSGKTRTVTISGKKVTVDATLSLNEVAMLTPDVLAMYYSEGSNTDPIVSVTTAVTSINETPNTVNTANVAYNEIASLSTISSSKLKVTTVVARIYPSDKTAYDCFRITSMATWLSAPLMFAFDKFAVCWSGDFALYSDYCRNYTNLHPSGTTNGTARSSVTPSAGLSYNIQMKYGANAATEYSTGCKIVASIYKSNATGTANAVAKYAHLTLGLSWPSVSLTQSGPTFSVGLGMAYQESEAIYAAFSY